MDCAQAYRYGKKRGDIMLNQFSPAKHPIWNQFNKKGIYIRMSSDTNSLEALHKNKNEEWVVIGSISQEKLLDRSEECPEVPALKWLRELSGY